jgi:glycine cleavage system regulatory protein
MKGGAMQMRFVLTIIGKDRTGLVEMVARLIADHGGNWLDSRMCRLGGIFAGILRIHVPQDRERQLVLSLQGLQSEGLAIVIQPDQAEPFPGKRKSAVLNIVGHDRPGIIHEISSALAHQNINVEELETECISAPMSGDQIFKAIAKLQIPESCVISELRKELEEIGSELMVDISFTPT